VQDPLLRKKRSLKRAGGVAQGVGLQFKTQYRQWWGKEFEFCDETINLSGKTMYVSRF
jgi:hypothetical protein